MIQNVGVFTRNTEFSLFPLRGKTVSATVQYFRPCFPVMSGTLAAKKRESNPFAWSTKIISRHTLRSLARKCCKANSFLLHTLSMSHVTSISCGPHIVPKSSQNNYAD